MSEGELLLDNSVLSALATCGWLEGLSVWTSNYDILTSRRIWHGEFKPHYDVEHPDWLDIEAADLSLVDTGEKELGAADWSLFALAEMGVNPIVVTNDKAVARMAEQKKGVDSIWGTKLVIRTFEVCGISREEYRQNQQTYIRDVHLKDTVIEALRTASK